MWRDIQRARWVRPAQNSDDLLQPEIRPQPRETESRGQSSGLRKQFGGGALLRPWSWELNDEQGRAKHLKLTVVSDSSISNCIIIFTIKVRQQSSTLGGQHGRKQDAWPPMQHHSCLQVESCHNGK